MRIQKLSTTDAFIVFDHDSAPAAGITRLARKVLTDGAELLARSTSYAFASFGLPLVGASAGINADGDGRARAVAAFVDEIRPVVAEGRWVTDPGLGLDETDLAPLRELDHRPRDLWEQGLATDLTVRGAVAAAGAVRGELAGARCSVVGGGPAANAAPAAIEAVGGEVVADGLAADVDVVFVAGKAGVVDHESASGVRAGVLVPLTPVPVTARAHAVLGRAGVVHVPDFLATAAPLLYAHVSEPGDPVGAVARTVSGFTSHGTDLWMAAALAAEDHMRTWRDEVPFGRPLA